MKIIEEWPQLVVLDASDASCYLFDIPKQDSVDDIEDFIEARGISMANVQWQIVDRIVDETV